ncbi:uncharacterized protein [Medicago truncatula]|uniref:uncharacterized protein isoform X2 n=1 Tax=Medicago truncatula TaxID=3880 RepID=UPI0019682CDB|nr:uncharacterized protein LOC25491221 isoform X2 [Medicago truncatula]
MKKMKLHHLCCVGTFIAHEVSKMLEATRLHITPILLISDNRVLVFLWWCGCDCCGFLRSHFFSSPTSLCQDWCTGG